MIAGMVFVLAITLVLLADPGDRAFNRDVAAQTLQIPATIQWSQEFGDLDYEGPPYLGVRLDLNGDGVPEYIVRGARRLCGNGGCPYAIFDGATFRALGTIFGSVIYVRSARQQRFAILQTYSSVSADEARYTTYVFDRTRYVVRDSVQLSGAALTRLQAELSRVQSLR